MFKSYEEESTMDNNLLQTIRIPKNLLVLTERLPQPNYLNKNSDGNFN